MARQFSYYCCPSDLAQIEREVFQQLGCTLICTEKRDETHTIAPVESFALPLERMGTDPLFLFLQPPEHLRSKVFAGPWLDPSRSHLIEVGRSYIKEGCIGLARFWVETRYIQNGTYVNKPAPFVAWASSVFQRTKKQLERHSFQQGQHTYTEWFGQAAWHEVGSCALRVAESAA